MHRMTMSWILTIAGFTFLSAPLSALETPAYTFTPVAAGHIVIKPEDLKWIDPPMLPPGVKLAILEGNPMASGPFTIRLKYRAGYFSPPHFHASPEHVTVLSGSLYIGLGEDCDLSKGDLLTPGTFEQMHPQVPHYVWTTEETIVQIHGVGPLGLTFVNDCTPHGAK